MTLSDITILKIKNADYWFISGISKSETIKILQNIYLTEKLTSATIFEALNLVQIIFKQKSGKL